MSPFALIAPLPSPPTSTHRIASLNSSRRKSGIPNTRHAYARAAVEFFDWLEARGVCEHAKKGNSHLDIADYMAFCGKIDNACST